MARKWLCEMALMHAMTHFMPSVSLACVLLGPIHHVQVQGLARVPGQIVSVRCSYQVFQRTFYVCRSTDHVQGAYLYASCYCHYHVCFELTDFRLLVFVWLD